jgi:penicillin-insensitive murein DD-endopeptidase
MPSAKSKFSALALCVVAFGSASTTLAQTITDNKTRRELALPVPSNPVEILTMPAKKLFGRQKDAADLSAKAIGTYARGCLSGAKAIPINGESWQVMRLSRNRMWGHPSLISLLEDLGTKAKASGEWNGLLVGDISQPRGGPMLTGHASHQIGLDADIWLTPMPDRVLSQTERENISAVLMTKNRSEINPKVWTTNQAKIIRRAALYNQVARIFVHPPIKAELCKWATGDRSWLAKVRPMFGHNYHFHIRMKCPSGVAGCKDQWTPKPKDGTGCGEELAYWMSDLPWKPRKPDPTKPKIPVKPAPPLTLLGLPAECRAVIAAP